MPEDRHPRGVFPHNGMKKLGAIPKAYKPLGFFVLRGIYEYA
jgi:hypothetical protein